MFTNFIHRECENPSKPILRQFLHFIHTRTPLKYNSAPQVIPEGVGGGKIQRDNGGTRLSIVRIEGGRGVRAEREGGGGKTRGAGGKGGGLG